MTGPSVTGHLDLDALADVLAGERSEQRHLRRCAACSERLAELAGAEVAVVASLTTLPPPPLPDGLAERLSGALRAEADRGADRDPGTAAVGDRTAPVTPLRRRRRLTTWLPAAAAAVALVLAGGVALTGLPGTGGPESASDAAGGGTGVEAAAPDEAVTDLSARAATSGTDYGDAAQRPAAVARLLDAGAVATGGRAPDAAAPERSASSLPLPAPALSGGPAADPVLERLRDPAALAECLGALRREGSPAAAPLALDLAVFEGAPALAVLQPDDAPGRLVLTVAGPGCSAADPDTLLRTRVDRP